MLAVRLGVSTKEPTSFLVGDGVLDCLDYEFARISGMCTLDATTFELSAKQGAQLFDAR